MASITVTSLSDDPAQEGTLRSAIAAANATPGADTIVFASDLKGTINLISNELLVTDDLTIDGPGQEVVTVRADGPFRIFKIDNNDPSLINVTIDGLTIADGKAIGDGGGIFTAENLTVTNSTIYNNTTEFGSGGGIYATGGTLESSKGTLELSNVDISDNRVQFGNGGGIALEQEALAALNEVDISGNRVQFGNGGGLSLFQADIVGGLTNSSISNNKASGNGGGISVNQATVNQLDTVDISNNAAGFLGGGISFVQGNLTDGNNLNILENEASRNGGGISADQGTVMALTNSNIKANFSGAEGGGISIQQATLADLNSNTIADNRAKSSGGGIYVKQADLIEAANNTISGNIAESFGGGIHAFQATVNGFTNNTISDNTGVIGGGLAIRDEDTKVELLGNTISGNTTQLSNGGGIFIDGSTVELTRNIVAANTILGGDPNQSFDIDGLSGSSFGNINSLGFNLIGNGDNVPSDSFIDSDLVGNSNNPIDPLLGDLADNGGPTLTLALLDGSPAIEAGDPNFKSPPDFDQRGPGSSSPPNSGFPRVSGDAIDIGAFEVTPSFNSIVGTSAADELIGTPNNDDINGLAGNDKIDGSTASDFLTGGGDQDKFIVAADEGTDVISDFGGVGTGTTPPPEVIAEVDTIQFVGNGLTVENMLLTKKGNNLEITFEPSGNTKVVLLDFELENLENLSTLGNIIFDGQQNITDSFDVVDADEDLTNILNPNKVTFLNDLENKTSGLDNSDDVINGQGGKDELDGLSGDDLLRGNEDEDKIKGGAGNDILIGGAGKDELTGGEGADQFAFITLRPFNISDLGDDDGDGGDKIIDFSVGQSLTGIGKDKIVLSKTTFTALESVVGGTLNPNEFEVVMEEEPGKTDNAENSSAFITYDITTGSLFYNPNGADPGFSNTLFGGGNFASLQGSPSLSATDFLIVD